MPHTGTHGGETMNGEGNGGGREGFNSVQRSDYPSCKPGSSLTKLGYQKLAQFGGSDFYKFYILSRHFSVRKPCFNTQKANFPPTSTFTHKHLHTPHLRILCVWPCDHLFTTFFSVCGSPARDLKNKHSSIAKIPEGFRTDL